MNLTNASGGVTEAFDHGCRLPSYRFGQVRNVLTGDEGGFHLTTKRNYSDIGLYYFYMRWYEPAWGRFGSRSPFPAFMEHPYVYCQNDSVNDTDPRGQIGIALLVRCWKSRICKAVVLCIAEAIGEGFGDIFWNLVYRNKMKQCSIGGDALCSCLTVSIGSAISDDPLKSVMEV
jgi:RHS repeat-associated protein